MVGVVDQDRDVVPQCHAGNHAAEQASRGDALISTLSIDLDRTAVGHRAEGQQLNAVEQVP